MKLVRFGKVGDEKPGVLDENGIIRDLSEVIDDVDGSTISPEYLNKLRKLNLSTLDWIKLNLYDESDSY